MRISDWSSDVCSSDLPQRLAQPGKSLGHVDFADVQLAGQSCQPDRAIHLEQSQRPLRQRWWGTKSGQMIRNRFCPAKGFRAQQAVHLIGQPDRKSVVEGKSVSVRVDPGCRRIIKKKI